MAKGWYERIRDIDRRWIFLFITLSVVLPLIFQVYFAEIPTPMVEQIFDKIDSLPAGSRVLIDFSYDPASMPELQPMAVAWVRHCLLKRHRIYAMALWPLGQQMAVDTINEAIDFIKKLEPGREIVYGIDYVNIGYKSGQQGVIKVVLTNLETLYSTDINGAHISKIPMMSGVVNLKSFDVIISVSAGYPGSKEWVQFGSDPAGVPLVSGSTAVQAPLMYPYYPRQMVGVLGGLKGAAEYEQLVYERKLKALMGKRLVELGHPPRDADVAPLAEQYLGYTQLGIKRMGPQTVAHLVIIIFVVIGNVTFFIDRRRARKRRPS
jgi:hypothetical protein